MDTEDSPAELNLTPYLDVMMNLIVFVLVTGAGLVTWGVVPAKTVADDAGQAAHVTPRVRLSQHGAQLSVAGEPAADVTLVQLTERLSGVSGRAFVLEAEGDVAFDDVIGAIDAAAKAHFDEVTLAD